MGDGQATDAQAEALEKLSAALEATDPYTHGHSRRVARHCWMIAKRMGLDSESVARVRTAASLHDVGKVYTPPAVLRKPGRLTDEEFDVIKRHPVDGAELVEALGDDELVSIVRHHHERLDGTGYPDRLVGDQIPLGARIISVADTFDAITSARPYRPARAHKKALDILKYEAGTQLDPAVVKAFCAIYSGRRPLALWASFTSLPSQVFSWLGAGAATAASAAQVAAVAAAAAVGVTAAMAPHHGSGRHSSTSGHVQIAEVASHPLTGASYGGVFATRATHGGSGPDTRSRQRHAGGSKPAPASAGSTPASGPTGPTNTAGEPSVSQAGSSEATAGSGGGSDQVSHEGSSTSSEPAGTGNQSSSEVKGSPIATESPKPVSGPKEGKGSDEGKKSKEEKEDREAKAREERASQRSQGSEDQGRKGRQRSQGQRRKPSQRTQGQGRKGRQRNEGQGRKGRQRSQGQRRKPSQRTQGQAGKGSQRSQRSQGQGRKKGQRRQRAHQRSARNGHRGLGPPRASAARLAVAVAPGPPRFLPRPPERNPQSRD